MKFTMIATLIAFVSATGFAGGLAEQKKWKKANEELAPYIDEAQKACGSKIKVKFDGDFKGWNETISLSGSCGNAAQGLGYLCAKDADNKAAGAKITSITCKSGKTASLTVKGNAMTYVMDTESGGMTSQQIADQLEKTL